MANYSSFTSSSYCEQLNSGSLSQFGSSLADAPGPVVLVSSTYNGEPDIFTMGQHLILMDEPSRKTIVFARIFAARLNFIEKRAPY